MKFLGRLSARRRVREAARALGKDASADNYVALAREYIVAGRTREVVRVCEEGLASYPGHAELERLAHRGRQLYQEDRLRELHPAAIARAMQGERAEAWAIVLGRLDDNARAALQLYLDASARAAIEDARVRQEELAKNSPALLATVVAAIARTVVPRAMREHHALLSTTPLAWTGQSA